MLNHLSRDLRGAAVVGALAVAAGCTPPTVRVPDVAGIAAPGAGSLGTVIVAAGAPAVMVDELKTQVRGWGDVREVVLASHARLVDACPADGYVVLRPALSRSHFVSNAGDRNTFLIYEFAVVVGAPVALVSLAVWPWYGETLVEGTLESVRCGSSTLVPSRVVASNRVRSEGHAIARTAAIQESQNDAAVRGVVRKLLAARAAEAPNQEGGVP